MFDSGIEFEIIRKKITERVKISIVWDGYYDPSAPEKQIEADTITGMNFTYDQVKSSLEDLTYVADYKSIVEQSIKMDARIKEQAIAVYGRTYHLRQHARSIPDSYFDHLAKKFAQKDIKDFIFVAPDMWLPNIKPQLVTAATSS